jgi:hypothetical protein
VQQAPHPEPSPLAAAVAAAAPGLGARLAQAAAWQRLAAAAADGAAAFVLGLVLFQLLPSLGQPSAAA